MVQLSYQGLGQVCNVDEILSLERFVSSNKDDGRMVYIRKQSLRYSTNLCETSVS